ncbi:MAG TPA: DNA polymerase IV [Candidatus Methylomirabilis sp.]|nr:DNA polymerase IV [Candidatus Methylomirabilis sp.]
MSGARSIIHLDMDAFYASVEQLDHPAYRGKPVVVGADPRGGNGRGVVAACSYEARPFGVRSALPISQAYRLCPQAVYVRPRMERYAEMSGRMFAILREHTDLVEPLSIDEAFLDVTGSQRLFGPAETIGRTLKSRIRAELGLVASIGLAPNKFLAKVASDLGKPDGFVVVSPGKEREFLAPLPISRLWGVGPKTEARLKKLGLQTIGQIARMGAEGLEAALGNSGRDLWGLANGMDEREVVPEQEAKSIGAETTFGQDTDDREEIRKTILELSDRVGRRLRREGYVAHGVTLKFRDHNFQTLTRASMLPQPTDLGEELFRAASALLQGVNWAGKRVRLLGVTATRLLPATGQPGDQLHLFQKAAEPKERLARTLDAIRERFGSEAITRASLIPAAPARKATKPAGKPSRPR